MTAEAGAAGTQNAGARAGGWRYWRGPAVVVALILLTGVVVALLQPAPGSRGALDPANTGPGGAHALAALLNRRGQPVIRVLTAASAARQARAPATTLVITSPGLLSRHSLAVLARAGAALLLVAPGRPALAALAPQVTLAGRTAIRSLPPRCGLAAARLAGSAELGGQLLRPAAGNAAFPGAWRCYPASAAVAGSPPPGPVRTGGAAPGSGLPSLVRYVRGGRTVTVLGSGAPLANANLGRDGNAALALNLLAPGSRVVWLAPVPGGPGTAAGPRRSLTSLLPPAVIAVTAELGVAVLLTALWRMRRLGPLVSEPLPVAVPAAETVTGHGRLYRSRRARDRAAAALRAAALTRLGAALGLPAGTGSGGISDDLASRTGRDAGEIRAVLSGPVPRDDAALVKLAAELDRLEGQVLNR